MRAYSQDLRDRALRAIGRGEHSAHIAKRLDVGRAWVYSVKSRFEKQGVRHSFQIGGHRKSRVSAIESELKRWIKEQPDLTLAQLCERLSQHGVTISSSALWTQLNKLGFSFKKKLSMRVNRTAKISRLPGVSG